MLEKETQLSGNREAAGGSEKNKSFLGGNLTLSP